MRSDRRQLLPRHRYADTALGKAQLMRDATSRIVGAFSITRAALVGLPGSPTGAAVLIDSRLANRAGRRDLRHRLLLVKYASAAAARVAVAGRNPSGFVERGREVLYFPQNFPSAAREDYRRAMHAGLQRTCDSASRARPSPRRPTRADGTFRSRIGHVRSCSTR
jgi:hypothetical protein